MPHTNKYEMPHKKRQTEAQLCVKELKKRVVDRDIPEFPPTKQYFVMTKEKKGVKKMVKSKK